MKGEREKILAMRAEGTITAEEAEELLAALPPDIEEPLPAAPGAWGELPARGEAWQRPFAVMVGLTGIGAVKLLITRRSSGVVGFMHRFLIWPFTLLAALGALLIYLSKEAPWLHVRVRRESGERFSFSVPYPGTAVRGALRVARERAESAEAQEQIAAAQEMLAGLDAATSEEPLLVDIEDDGGSIQVYLN